MYCIFLKIAGGDYFFFRTEAIIQIFLTGGCAVKNIFNIPLSKKKKKKKN